LAVEYQQRRKDDDADFVHEGWISQESHERTRWDIKRIHI
jgi:hypothetical protein